MNLSVAVTVKAIANLSTRRNQQQQQTKYIITMTNTRVGERLSKLNEVPSEVDRSEELAGLADKFRAFMKQFKPLTDALNARYNAMKEAEKAQAEVRF